MADPTLDDTLSAYLAQPVTGDHAPATWSLSPALIVLLQQMAAERNVPVDALVEFYLFKQLRNEQARRLVGERPDPIPSSFLNAQVARAKVDVARDVAAVKGNLEDRGDRAARVAAQMEGTLSDTSDVDFLETVRRRAAESDAQVDLALDKERKKQ